MCWPFTRTGGVLDTHTLHIANVILLPCWSDMSDDQNCSSQFLLPFSPTSKGTFLVLCDRSFGGGGGDSRDGAAAADVSSTSLSTISALTREIENLRPSNSTVPPAEACKRRWGYQVTPDSTEGDATRHASSSVRMGKGTCGTVSLVPISISPNNWMALSSTTMDSCSTNPTVPLDLSLSRSPRIKGPPQVGKRLSDGEVVPPPNVTFRRSSCQANDSAICNRVPPPLVPPAMESAHGEVLLPTFEYPADHPCGFLAPPSLLITEGGSEEQPGGPQGVNEPLGISLTKWGPLETKRVAVKCMPIVGDVNQLDMISRELRAILALAKRTEALRGDAAAFLHADAPCDEDRPRPLVSLDGLVPVYAVDHEDQSRVLVHMKPFAGSFGASDIAGRRSASLGEGGLRFIARSVLAGLAHLHACGIVHNDLKPANVLYGVDGTTSPATPVVAVCDFGACDVVVCGAAHAVIGTGAYMSPERTQLAVYDGRGDVWALGLTLVEVGAGVPLFGVTVARHVLGLLGVPMLPDPYANVKLCYSAVQRGEGITPEQWPGTCRGLVLDHLNSASSRTPSESFLSFIAACLALDPRRRPDAVTLVGHPWLREHDEREDASVFAEWQETLPRDVAPCYVDRA